MPPLTGLFLVEMGLAFAGFVSLPGGPTPASAPLSYLSSHLASRRGQLSLVGQPQAWCLNPY